VSVASGAGAMVTSRSGRSRAKLSVPHIRLLELALQPGTQRFPPRGRQRHRVHGRPRLAARDGRLRRIIQASVVWAHRVGGRNAAAVRRPEYLNFVATPPKIEPGWTI
jgi:hypothetical protein